MKMIAIILFVGCLQVSAKTYAQNINLKMQNVSLKEVIKQVEKQSDYYFIYRNEWLKHANKVDVNIHNATIQEVMKAILNGQPLSYSIVDKNVVIEKKPFLSSTQTTQEQLTERPLKGVVVDSATGEPLAGVSIKIKGSTMGTITDADGSFGLNVEDKDVLIVSYLGYTTREIDVQGKESIHILLSSATKGLNQLVVVGYGTQKKKDVTGSISQINFDDEGLNDIPVTNVAKAIQGRIPNLNISFSTGRPGLGGGVNVRGYNSINGGSPLVLVDGSPQSINEINPNDVKSVTVLKDAGAAAIYGARAAYGVVLITTKSGQSGKPKITYSTNYGIATQVQKTDFITTGYDEVIIWDSAMLRTLGKTVTGYTQKDYEELKKRRFDKYENPDRPWELVENRNGRDQFVYYGNFDWWNFMYRKYMPFHKHALSISGGGNKINYYLSGDIRKQAGIWKINPDIYKRQDLRAKISANIFPWLKITNNSSFYHYKYNYGRFNSFGFSKSINDYYSPSYMPLNPDGSFTFLTGMGNYTIGHGLHAAMLDGNSWRKKSFYLFRNTTSINMNFLDNRLKIRGNYTALIDYDHSPYRNTKVYYSLYPGVKTVTQYDKDLYKERLSVHKQNDFNVYSSYGDNFGKHSFTAMIGGNFTNVKNRNTSSATYDLLSENLSSLSLGTDNPTVDGSSSEWDIMGLFGRFMYNFDSKYYFQFNGRYDGTSRFPEADRFGFFPSFSVAWVLSEESFFSNLKKTINRFKVRISYGTLGNQSVGTYAYIPTMSTTNSDYVINNQTIKYIGMPNPVSSSLTWEDVTTKNIGIDASFIENRLTVSLDGYIKETKGMLTKGKTLPAVYGAPEPQENAANLKNRGWEISINWRNSFNLLNKKFNYYIKLGVSDYTGVITKFDNPDSLINDYYVGKNMGEIWGFITDGYFKTQKEADNYPVNQHYVNRRVDAAPPAWRGLRPGDIKFVDLDGDHIIGVGSNTVSDPGDQKIIGNSTPRYKFGITLGGSWNNFDISMFFQGIGKQNWYPGKGAFKFWGPYYRPYVSLLPINMKDKIWSPDNPNAYFPLLRGYIASSGGLVYPNNRYLQNLAYIRLKNLSFGYSLPSDFLQKFHVKKLRIYFSGNNLFTLSALDTKYIDPESAGAGDFGHGNTGARVYPFSTKIFSFGLDITF